MSCMIPWTYWLRGNLGPSSFVQRPPSITRTLAMGRGRGACRSECRWRCSRLESDRLSYIEQCSVVNTMLYKAKEFFHSLVIRDNAHDTRLLFWSIDKLLQKQTEKHYPSADNDQQLANDFADFFPAKIERVREGLALRKSGLVHSPGLAKPACL